MFELIGSVAAVLEVVTKAYTGGKWVRKTIREWKTPPKVGRLDSSFRIPIEYYALSKDYGEWRNFHLGNSVFREEGRVIQDRWKLIDFYPALRDKLLVDNRIGMMPYETISSNVEEVKIVVSNAKFEVQPSLLQLYEKIKNGLVQYYRKVGIQYEPTHLVRVCNWETNKIEKVCLEETAYTEAAATNMIADLDVQKALHKSLLLENGSGLTRSIREFDISLSDEHGRYPHFLKSALANPIGVAGIAVTTDNKIILAHRSKRVSMYANKIGPSSSGYVTWHDVQYTYDDSFNNLLLNGLKREIAEELHVDLAKDVSDFYPLGFFREFCRAGMPQVFYCFRINMVSESLIERIKDAQDFRECVGIFAIPVNKKNLAKTIASLVRIEHIGSVQLGLEAQGLLTAFALRGENILF